jgi:hypothetical protein
MSTTGMQVFEIAMGLIDTLSNGLAEHAGTADYKARTASVINNLLPELYLYSDTRSDTDGRRPMPAFITDLTQSLDLDDALARAVLPHALVSALLAEENPALAAYHEQKYLEVLSRLRNTPRVPEEIERIYGVLRGSV